MKKFLLIVYLYLPFKMEAQIWDSVPGHPVGSALYLKEIDNLLWVSGVDSVDGIKLSGLGTWNGSQWDSVGGGLGFTGGAESILKFNNEFYIGGAFLSAGGNPIKHLTKWDGSQFYNIANITSNGGHVNALIVYNNELYAGGRFQQIGGQNIKFFAKYNGGTSWSQVGGGLTGTFGEVDCMTIYNGELIVGGLFATAGGVAVNNIAKWNGTSWSQMGSGFNYFVRDFEIDTINNVLYAAGSFTYAGTIPVNFVAKWDGVSWIAMSNGLPHASSTAKMHHNKLFVGSSYDSTLAWWDGNLWNLIQPYPNGTLTTLEVFQNELYVGGGFNAIGGVPYVGIARYVDSTTSIYETEHINHLSISPNPFSDCIYISSSNFYENYLLDIRNILGEEVHTQKLSMQGFHKAELNLSFLKQGIYFLTARQGKETITKKIVKL